MGLYLLNGYADMKSIIEHPEPFIFCVGGRGTGKTYGALLYALTRQGDHGSFLYLRRSQTETETVMNDAASPFKVIQRDIHDLDITIDKAGKQLFSIRNYGEIIGYAASLATFRNVRGVDFSDVDLIIYDEFIPEKGARPITNEYNTFYNMYETVNRNRELSGSKPVKCISLANSNDIANPIFMGLQVVNRIGTMMDRHISIWCAPERGLRVYMLMDSPISKAKAVTALYRLSGAGSDFTGMALENIFRYDKSCICSRAIREYRPLVKVGEMVVYKHKSRGEYYINCSPSGTVRYDTYTTDDADLERFRGKYTYLYIRYMQKNLLFEDPASLVLFERIFK